MSTLLESLKSDWAMSVKSQSKEPLYHQLFVLLRNSIVNGTIAHGAQVPTEQQLSAAFGISRITVKRAMDDLATEGLITRQRGKGSHVTHNFEPEPVKAPLVGMLENLEEMSKHSRVRVISIESLVPPADLRAELGLEAQEEALKILRVRSNEEGEPYAYYLSWTNADKKLFTKKRVESKTRNALLKESGTQLARVEQTLGAENADSRIASQLEVPLHTALLTLTRRSFDEAGALVDILFGYYNPRLFTYKMVLGLDE